MTFFAVGLVGAMIIAALAQDHVVLTALGVHMPVMETVLPAVATLVIVTGNFMGKTRANFFVGVRTPWTLESDHSWEKTNRWARTLLHLLRCCDARGADRSQPTRSP